MTDRRELIRREISGVYTGTPGLPAPTNRDERQIAQKADNGRYGVLAAEQVYVEAQRAAAHVRVHGTRVYAAAAERMVHIQNNVCEQARDFVEPFVYEQAIELAHDLTGLGSAAVGNFHRSAGQNYLPEPKKGWFGR